MKGQELLFFNPLLGGRQSGVVSQHSPETTQTGGMRLSLCTTSHPWGHLAPAQGLLSPCQQLPSCPTLSPGSASGLYLFGGYSVKAQIYLLKMLVFRERELTATAHTQQPRGRSDGNGGSGGQCCMEAIPFSDP